MTDLLSTEQLDLNSTLTSQTIPTLSLYLDSKYQSVHLKACGRISGPFSIISTTSKLPRDSTEHTHMSAVQ